MIIPPIYQDTVRIMARAGQVGDIVIDHVDCKAIGTLTIIGEEWNTWFRHILCAWTFQKWNWN